MKNYKRLITLLSIFGLLCVVYYHSVLLPNYEARVIPVLNEIHLMDQLRDELVGNEIEKLEKGLTKLEKSSQRLNKHIDKLKKDTPSDRLFKVGF